MEGQQQAAKRPGVRYRRAPVENKTPSATLRLKQDYMMLMKNPDPFVKVAMNPADIFEWHYILTGPPHTPYHNGVYHGKLRFPPEYPFRPPSFYMITPNGRFETNTKICLSISDFHPNSWNPTWNMSTILTALLSFMTENSSTTGSIVSIDSHKRTLARKSYAWNLANAQFVQLFPEVAKELQEKVEEIEKMNAAAKTNKASATDVPVSNGGAPVATGAADEIQHLDFTLKSLVVFGLAVIILAVFLFYLAL